MTSASTLLRLFLRGLCDVAEAESVSLYLPIPIEGSEFVFPVDNVVLSIGNKPNPLLLQTTKGLEANKWGCLVVEDETAQTSLRRVFAGGDAVTGAATVILAAGAGKRAAEAIHADLVSDAA